MAGLAHYSDAPSDSGVSSSGRPLTGEGRRNDEPASDPALLRARTSRTGVILGSILGIGAGLVIVGLMSTRGREPALAETPELPARETAWSMNPGYESALGLPALPLPGAESNAPDSERARMTPAAADAASPMDQPVGSQPLYDERENVSGSDSESQESGPSDAPGRDVRVGVPDLDVGDLDVHGPGDARPKEEPERRIDRAPAQSQSTDNPY